MEHIVTYQQENFRKELNPKNFKKRICVPILKETQPIYFFSAYRGVYLFSGGIYRVTVRYSAS